MGNCFCNTKTRTHLSEIAPSSSDHFSANKPSPPPLVFLHGDSSDSLTHYLRFALHYKPLVLRFIPSDTLPPPHSPPSFILRVDDATVSGSAETILRFVESKLPLPPLLKRDNKEAVEDEVMRMVELQHRSVGWHVERVAKWGMDMETRGGREAVDRSVGTARMEASKLEKSYGKLLEVMLEHAQMEERILFPILQAADPGVCRCVNEEHARDLPIMNGIKEDIKSIGVINTGTSTHREALSSLSVRLETLQDNCRNHFHEEEKNLFPLMEAAGLTREQQRKVVDQCIDVMQGTHSHLFRFFIDGLQPHEAIEYLDLIMKCVNKERVSSMLRLLVD